MDTKKIPNLSDFPTVVCGICHRRQPYMGQSQCLSVAQDIEAGLKEYHMDGAHILRITSYEAPESTKKALDAHFLEEPHMHEF
jgi:hypothetical protein